MLSTGRSRRRWRRGSARPTGERPPPQNPEPPQQPRDTPRTPKKNPKPSQQPAGSSPALLRSPFAHPREGHPALGIGGMRLWDSLGGSLKSPTSLGGVGGAWGGAVRVMRMGVLSIGGGGGGFAGGSSVLPTPAPLPKIPRRPPTTLVFGRERGLGPFPGTCKSTLVLSQRIPGCRDAANPKDRHPDRIAASPASQAPVGAPTRERGAPRVTESHAAPQAGSIPQTKHPGEVAGCG